MHPGIHARNHPEKAAHVMGRSGEVVTYAELDSRAWRLSRLMRSRGLNPGEHVSIFMENHPRYPEVYWAAIRAGLYVTTVNQHLTAEEAAYIVDDSGSRLVVTSAALATEAEAMLDGIPSCPHRLMADGAVDGFESYEEAIGEHSDAPLEDAIRGGTMLYSSGTTGRPKGIKRPLSGKTIDEPEGLDGLLSGLFKFSESSVYLCPAPLYHSAPLGFSMATQAIGGTVVIMEKFDAAEALRCIEAYRCTHSQWVPTMFSRLLRLPEEERSCYDVSSLEVAVHAAAPCPPTVKEQMIGWWGPVLYEYYAGTEVNGFTFIDSGDWLAHRGSVGRSILGKIHICAEDGTELPAGEAGTIYFELPRMPFEYHNDSEKTRSAQHPDHPNWSTLGDVGRVDDEGYLYLTDRKTYMIISGGVNIYPAEIENVLVDHPKVLDVAVFGIPDEEFGEEVKAVVQLVAGTAATPALEQELLEYCRAHLAHYKCPRSIDFEPELPRLPTGKLYKRLLRDRYWGEHETRIV
ncbi:MAG: AMP-binding protein [Acidimicrobiia bacterium]|nr:AMP-binding protein [Acidimicrobiia bacterium]